MKGLGLRCVLFDCEEELVIEVGSGWLHVSCQEYVVPVLLSDQADGGARSVRGVGVSPFTRWDIKPDKMFSRPSNQLN